MYLSYPQCQDDDEEKKHGDDKHFCRQASCSCVPIHAGAFSQLEVSHNFSKFLWKKKKPIRDLILRLGSFSSQLRVFSLSSPWFSATGEILHLRTTFSFSTKISGKGLVCSATRGLEEVRGKPS